MRALALLLLIGCARAQTPTPAWESRQHKLDEMDRRLAEIRQWRHEKGMRIEPAQPFVMAARGQTVHEAKNVCPDNHVVPKSCGDVCLLSDDICDNAEAICAIADELGKDDREGQDRCASAKASCAEAKKNCCDCTPVETP
jgi:hypothetical protein